MKTIRDLVETAGAVLLAVVVVSVLVQVVARYILQMSVPWTEELARYTQVWLTLVGAAAAAAGHQQITVDLITPHLRGRWRAVVQMTATVGGFIAVAVLTWASLGLVVGYSSRTTTPAMGIEFRWVYLALPVGGALLALFLLSDIGRLARGKPILTEDHVEPRAGAAGDSHEVGAV